MNAYLKQLEKDWDKVAAQWQGKGGKKRKRQRQRFRILEIKREIKRKREVLKRK